MNSPNGTLFLLAWSRPWQRHDHGMTTAGILPALFEFLYREFCRARLAEMRKPLLIRPDGLEVPEDACFSGLGDLQDEAKPNVIRPSIGPSGASSGCSGAAHASL